MELGQKGFGVALRKWTAACRRQRPLTPKTGLSAKPLLAVVLVSAIGAALATPAQSRGDGDAFTITAVGDLLEVRPVLPLNDKEFSKVSRVLASADAVFGNGEMPLIDIKQPDTYPEAENGGGNAYGDKSVADDWKRMGFSLIARSNNHVSDWGVAGMRQTNEALTRAGLVFAGSGESEAEARRAQFFESPKGRIALVATTTRFTHDEPAADPLGEVHARPGASVLRSTPYILVSPDTLADLKQRFGSSGAPAGVSQQNELSVLGQKFRSSAASGIDYLPNQDDLEGISAGIRQGKKLSRFVAFSFHSHESRSGRENDLPLSDAVTTLAHRAIDAGADAVFGHGPHQVGGVEIYHGKPIFYSLGSFIFQLDLLENIYPDGWRQRSLDPKKTLPVDYWGSYLHEHFADPIFWQSVIARSKYVNGRVTEIDLIPLDLRQSASPLTRGIPSLATGEEGGEILRRMQRLSEPFHTRIEIRNGIGVIRL